MTSTPDFQPSCSIERLKEWRGSDLHDLCDATELAIEEGGGFGWIAVPERDVLEKHWAGVLLMPQRTLFVARLDGVICGSAQLCRQPANNEAQAHTGQLMSFFIAPWARGHGLAARMVRTVEAEAQNCGLAVLNLDVRATQAVAIRVYDRCGFVRWGTQPDYAFVGGKWVAGHHYSKILHPT